MLMEPAATAEIGRAKVAWHYTEPTVEYRALRTEAAVFDLSSVGLIAVPTRTAPALLRPTLPRNFDLLYPGASGSAMLLDDRARPADLLVVHRLRDRYLIETAFGRGAATLDRLRDAPGGDELSDVRDEYATIGIEGPYAWRVVRALLGDGTATLPLNGVTTRDWRGVPAIVSRSGFTGEYGYKVLVPAGDGPALFQAAAELATPAGFHALETAMLEVRQPVLHRECGPDDTVLTCGYNWLVDLEHPTFVGRDALLGQVAAGPAARPVGLILADTGAALPPDAAVLVDGLPVGRIVWYADSPGLGRTLALARLEQQWAATGIEVHVDTGHGLVAGVTAPSPYVTPASWSIPIG
jgi:aminomethyltransferase